MSWRAWLSAWRWCDVVLAILPGIILSVITYQQCLGASDAGQLRFLRYGGVRTTLAKVDEEFRERFRAVRPDSPSSERIALIGELNRKLYDLMQSGVIVNPGKLSDEDVVCVGAIADRLRMWGIAHEYAQMAVNRNRENVEAHFIRVRSLLNMKQLDAALSAADEANAWCPNCGTLYILHYHLYRSCRSQQHDDRFEQITLLFDRCSEQAASDLEAVKTMSNSLEHFREEYEHANALSAMGGVLEDYRDRARHLVQLQQRNESKDRKVFLHVCELRRLVCRIDRVLKDGRQGCEDLAEWCDEIAKEISRDGVTEEVAYGFSMAMMVYKENQEMFSQCGRVREALSVVRDGAMAKRSESRLATKIFRLCEEIDFSEKAQPVADSEPVMQ